jgi:hypothetical protein
MPPVIAVGQAEGQVSVMGSRLDALARLRVLVALLGERDRFGWWSTAVLSSTGRRFMTLCFPRTAAASAITTVVEAAKVRHDERIGRTKAFHLFRLPHMLEQDIHGLLRARAVDLLADPAFSPEAALDTIAAIAGDTKASAPGAIRVASVQQLTHSPSIRKTAACYHSAFADGHQSFPYFSSA